MFIWCLDCLSELGGRIEIGGFDILEVAVGAYHKLGASSLVGYDQGFGMHLQGRYGPHLRYATFYTVMEGAGFVVAVDNQEYALGCHYSAHTYGKSSLGNKVNVTFEETGIGDDGILSQRLHTSF